MRYDHIHLPADGAAITINPDHSLVVPDKPIIPFIEGDGIGIDVTPVMLDVVNAAVAKAYGKNREIRWMQVYAGQAAAELKLPFFGPPDRATMKRGVSYGRRPPPT